MSRKTYTVRSVEETWQVAAEVARQLVPGMVIALHGDLGAGKTTFVQGLGFALGLKRPVTVRHGLHRTPTASFTLYMISTA